MLIKQEKDKWEWYIWLYDEISNLWETVSQEVLKLLKERNKIVLKLTKNQDIPFLKVNWTHNDIVSSLYLYDFFDLTNSIWIDELLNEIELWDFNNIKNFIESKIKLLRILIKENPEKALSLAEEFPQIIKIINSLLIKPWKDKDNLKWIQEFLEYLEDTLLYIMTLFDNNFSSVKWGKTLTLDLELETLKLLRNYAKKVCYKKTNTIEGINLLSEESVKIIWETSEKIEEIIEDPNEKEFQKMIWKILKTIAIIEKYEQIINIWWQITSKDKQKIKNLLNLIILYNNKITTSWINTGIDMQIIKSLFDMLVDRYNENWENAITDGLTWIWNKRYHDWYLEKIASNVSKNNRTCDKKVSNNSHYYFLIDIDNYKSFNDKYWHDIWDKVLQHFAKIVNNKIRKNDIFFRNWWDEFSIISDRIDRNQAEGIAKKIIETLEEEPYIDEKWVEYKMTVSIWISEFNEELCNQNSTWIEVFNAADIALYKMKDDWRNWYRFFDEEKNSTIFSFIIKKLLLIIKDTRLILKSKFQ